MPYPAVSVIGILLFTFGTAGEIGMLNGISKILSGELLKLMMNMDHGDELVIGKGAFQMFPWVFQ